MEDGRLIGGVSVLGIQDVSETVFAHLFESLPDVLGGWVDVEIRNGRRVVSGVGSKKGELRASGTGCPLTYEAVRAMSFGAMPWPLKEQ